MYKYAVCYIGSRYQVRIRFTGNPAFFASQFLMHMDDRNYELSYM